MGHLPLRGWLGGLLAAAFSPMGFQFDLGGFSVEPMAVAAPGPVFGFLDEAPVDWIAVNVAELLDELGLGEDIEVVVAALPELGTGTLEAL